MVGLIRACVEQKLLGVCWERARRSLDRTKRFLDSSSGMCILALYFLCKWSVSCSALPPPPLPEAVQRVQAHHGVVEAGADGQKVLAGALLVVDASMGEGGLRGSARGLWVIVGWGLFGSGAVGKSPVHVCV